MWGIAIPFSVGTAAGAAASTALSMTQQTAAVSSSVCLLCIAVMLPFFLSRNIKGLPAALFFACGLFCCLSAHARGEVGLRPEIADRALKALTDLIDSIPYGEKRCRAVVKALLSGDRSEVDKETWEAFRDAGASHILALSGLHLGSIYIIIRRMLAVAGNSITARRARCGVTMLLCGFYALMTGLGPSLMRALIFICINETAKLDPERRTDTGRTYMTALMIQLALSPESITSVSFLLSYLAMAGLVFVSPHIEGWYPGTGPGGWIWKNAARSIGCQLTTAPLVWYCWRSFPGYFLLTNLLALPLTSIIMYTTIAVLTLSAAGICPPTLVEADEWLIKSLIHILGTISSL